MVKRDQHVHLRLRRAIGKPALLSIGLRLKRDQTRTSLRCAIRSRSQVARLLTLMSSFLMRFRRVDGGTPNTSAAPPLPAINPLVISTTSEMCSLSASASVHTLPKSNGGLEFSEFAAS